MTIEIDPELLPEAQTFIYQYDFISISNRTEDEEGNITITGITVENVVSYGFSIPQPNVTISAVGGKVLVEGFYRMSDDSAAYYVDAPLGNDITDEPFISFGEVPPRKHFYKIVQNEPEGIIVRHYADLDTVAGGINIAVDRFVYHNIYTAYTLLGDYIWYSTEE